MNANAYGVNWIKRGVHHQIKQSPHMIHDDDIPDDHLMSNGSADEEFLVNNEDPGDLDQIAARNLIFMARDGQLAEFIQASTDENGTVIVSASDAGDIDYAAVLQEAADFDENNVSYVENYADDHPQMVTEEVITDDWVQYQGEDRVEVTEDQILASSGQALPEIEVPLPTVQDEYTALRPYPCDFCSRRFKKKLSLMNHLIIAHQNNRPHLCKLCDSRFFRKSELIHHLRAHAENDPMEPEEAEPGGHNMEINSHYRNDHFYEQDWQNDVPVSTYSSTEREQTFSNNYSNSLDVAPTTSRGRISRLKLKEFPSLEENISSENLQSNYYMDTVDIHQKVVTKREVGDYSKPHVLKHFPVLNDSKPFVCQQCGLAFAREKALLSHSKTHHTVESQFECNECSETFVDEDGLLEHQKVHQFEESNSEFDPAEAEESRSDSEPGQNVAEFYCTECGIAFHRLDLLKRHERMHLKQNPNINLLNHDVNESGQHSCTTCGESFDEALNLLAHAEIHARHPPLKCQLCGEGFYDEQDIKNHLKANHAKELTTTSCILCGKQCRDRKALMKHAWEHSREKCHSCSKCGKSFHNKARLKRHMSSHRDKSVVCDVCQAEFPDGRSLSNHRHSHSANSNGKLFPCNECGKTFGSRSSQQIHVRIHTGERPYGCRFCWKAFADGGTLRKHERIHTGEKPYVCSVCPRAFNQRVVLRDHIRSHHSALDSKRNTYFCSVCSSDLPSSNDLIQHLIEHSDKNTALKRAPVTGPRKYKRRRKLKPYELAHLQNEAKKNEAISELDISDFDMDDILGITNKSNSSSVNKAASSKNVSDQFIIDDDLSNEEVDIGDNSSAESMNDQDNSVWHGNSIKIESQPIEDAYDNSLESLLSEKKRGRVKKEESTAQRTQQVQYTKSEITNGFINKPRKKTENLKKNSGPRMIHTEKMMVAQNEGSNKKRSRAVVTRKENPEINFLANSTCSTIVNDYEIISPDLEPPRQISSSPLHSSLGGTSASKRRKKNQPSQETLASHSQVSARTHDMFDAQLLLDPSRKSDFDKFNPVNDLEDILGSPLKGGKGDRQRFTSESSATQFMTEHSEEDQLLIKIEPTSPDLRDIVTGGMSEITPRKLRRRDNSVRKKYLEFDANNGLGSPLHLLPSTPKRQTYEAQNSTARTTPIGKTSLRNMTPKVSSYSNFVLDSFGSSPVSVDSSYFSLSAVVSAADASAAAAEAAAYNANQEKKNRRVYECEMCSEVFTDRAQLLDHVHIHI